MGIVDKEYKSIDTGFNLCSTVSADPPFTFKRIFCQLSLQNRGVVRLLGDLIPPLWGGGVSDLLGVTCRNRVL